MIVVARLAQNCDAVNPVVCEDAAGTVTCHPEGHDCGGNNPGNNESICTDAAEPIACGSSSAITAATLKALTVPRSSQPM